ncbi:uncharacterized protein LOC129794045 [Lutzomyia longipalpis]|uniref:uncharacterized protein LOC129794045 n=1 Tax=Lutzomyia longipalpis TaxID=7200 RepID=UPI002483DF3A|nr:uncharacterized protein LOC129794045 [Lutzomyia longipalpis]
MEDENHGRGATEFLTTPVSRRGRLPESFYSSIHKKPHTSKVKKRKSSAGLGETTHSRSHRSQEDFSVEYHHNTFPRRKSVECTNDGGSSMRNGEGEVRIGQQYWKGEIGIKSFNYYLLKEGLKTTRNGTKKAPPDSEVASSGVNSDGALERMPSFRHGDENVYEEIYLMAKNEARKAALEYPDCEICASQWESENKENDTTNESQDQHVLKFQSYNPNNPGIYKTETTPVAFPCDYNPLKTIIAPCDGREYSSCESLLREDSSFGRRSARFSDQEHPQKRQQRGSMKSVESLTSSQPSCHCGSSDSDCMFFDCQPCPYDLEKCSFSDNTHCQDCDDYVRRRMRRNNTQEIHYLPINQRHVKKSEYWSGSLPHLKRDSLKKSSQVGVDCGRNDCRIRTLDRRTTRSSDQFNFLSAYNYGYGMIEKNAADRGAFVPNHAAKVAANADFLARSKMEIREKINSKRHSLIDDPGVIKSDIDGGTKKPTTMRRRKKSAGAIPKIVQDGSSCPEGGSRSGSRRPSQENVQKISTYGSHSDDQIFYSVRDSHQKREKRNVRDGSGSSVAQSSHMKSSATVQSTGPTQEKSRKRDDAGRDAENASDVGSGAKAGESGGRGGGANEDNEAPTSPRVRQEAKENTSQLQSNGISFASLTAGDTSHSGHLLINPDAADGIEIDFCDFPLPKTPEGKGKPFVDTTTHNVDKVKDMHYHNPTKTSTYLFGETTTQQNDIFLNRSGWVQVKHRPEVDEQQFARAGSRKNDNHRKLEELIARNEARKLLLLQNIHHHSLATDTLQPPLRDDRPMSPTTGFHIISPPPAFQDTSAAKSTFQPDPKDTQKRMVFSRSFECDAAKLKGDYKDSYSKSFEFDYEPPKSNHLSVNQIPPKNRASAFASLTGISPNYLTGRTQSFKVQPEPAVQGKYQKPTYATKTGLPPKMGTQAIGGDKKKSTAVSSVRATRGGGSTFATMRGYRSLTTQSSINKRLNSYDSGTRSDFSNDEEDNETPTLPQYQQNYVAPFATNMVTDYQVGGRNRSRSAFPAPTGGTRLHRSNTVESRSMAPAVDERTAIMIRTPQQLARSYEATYLANSMRAAKNYEEDDVYVSSRSSSSSVEDVGASTDIYRRQPSRQSTESRIRRSRSLQLSLRSPSRVPMTVRAAAGARTGRNSKYPPPTPHPVALLNQQSNNAPQARSREKGGQPKLKQDTNTRSLDMDGKSFGGSFDFDPKVTSFDERHFINSSNERIFAESKFTPQQQQQQPSGQNQRGQSSGSYGSRLYEHELVYQPWRRNRSPIMDYGPKTKVAPKRDSSLPPYHSQTPSTNTRSEQDSSESCTGGHQQQSRKVKCPGDKSNSLDDELSSRRSDMYSSCIESSNSGAGMKVKNDFQKKSDTPKETLIKIPCSSNVNSQMMTDSKCSNAKIDPPSAARDSTADDDTGGGGDLQDSSALLSPARANYRSKSLPKSFMRGSHLKKSTGSRPTKLTNQMRAVSSPLVTEETFTFVTNESQIPENETLTVASSNESVLQKFKKSITQFRGKHSRKRNKCGECEAQLSKAMSKSEESRLMTKTDSEPEIFKENLSQSFPDSLTSLQEEEEKAPIYAEAVFAFQASDTQELALRKGDLIEVFVYDDCPWWWGRLMIPDPVPTMGSPATRDGWFPRDFVKVIPSVAVRSKKAESLAANPPQDPLGDTRARNGVTGDKPSISSQEYQMNFRDNAIRELLDAETAYVNLLSSLCYGFLHKLRLHTEIFPMESINCIFSNIEDILHFQEAFLDALKAGISNHSIAKVFLSHQAAFSVYSTYCNSHPRGFMELEKYTGNKAACEILERCRKCEKLPELPLTAHLLAPIQRICRYPLHLSELVKYFPSNPNFQRDVKKNEDMMDCKESFELALGTMKKVAEMVNEEKRNSEHMSRIQTQFDNFTGPPLHFHSTRLFLQIDAIRLSPNLWNNTFTLFLFDRQIIYCRKDFMKRTHFIYKGRIFLDNCSILNLPDGKMFGVTLKNALRIYCDTRNKWHDFCFRSAAHKIRFLNTLSVERQYCGTSLFVSEFAGTADDDNITDDENLGVKKPPDGDINRTEVVPPLGGGTTSNGQAKKPKPDVSHYDVPKKVIPMEEGGANRRHLGSWFRKPKSTNSTPFQSPTHRPPPVDGFGMQRNSMDGRSAPKNTDPSAKAS